MSIYKHENVSVIRFGTGDEGIAPAYVTEEGTGRIYGTVSFIPQDPEEIGIKTDYDDPKSDIDMGAHTRLEFTDMKSIDALIDALQVAKSNMGLQRNQRHG